MSKEGTSPCDTPWIPRLREHEWGTAMIIGFVLGRVAIFWIQLLVSLGVFSLVTVWYVWPKLTKLARNSTLTLLLFANVFRYVGLIVLVKGMVDPKLPHTFLSSAAYGDLLAAALALASIVALRSNWRFVITLVWVANTWGFLDLLNGVRGVIESNIPSYNLSTLWYIYVFYAPVVIISELLIFTILVKSRSLKKAAIITAQG
jgi:hypothetical protein